MSWDKGKEALDINGEQNLIIISSFSVVAETQMVVI